jgi:hypothetical protein
LAQPDYQLLKLQVQAAAQYVIIVHQKWHQPQAVMLTAQAGFLAELIIIAARVVPVLYTIIYKRPLEYFPQMEI